MHPPITIHFATPYSSSKDFGKSINDFCALVPDGDWICLRDGDSMFLTPDWGRQIYDVVAKHGNDYAVFGCVTNRLARATQIHDLNMYDNHNVLDHYHIAAELERTKWAQIRDITTSRCVAGLMLLFSKQTWDRIKFKEKTHHFDSQFSKDVIAKGGRLALIEGLYVYHWYRGWAKDPVHEVKHLLAK